MFPILILNPQSQMFPGFADGDDRFHLHVAGRHGQGRVARAKWSHCLQRVGKIKVDLLQFEPGIDLQGRFFADDTSQLTFHRFAESLSERGELFRFHR